MVSSFALSSASLTAKKQLADILAQGYTILKQDNNQLTLQAPDGTVSTLGKNPSGFWDTANWIGKNILLPAGFAAVGAGGLGLLGPGASIAADAGAGAADAIPAAVDITPGLFGGAGAAGAGAGAAAGTGAAGAGLGALPLVGSDGTIASVTAALPSSGLGPLAGAGLGAAAGVGAGAALGSWNNPAPDPTEASVTTAPPPPAPTPSPIASVVPALGAGALGGSIASALAPSNLTPANVAPASDPTAAGGLGSLGSLISLLGLGGSLSGLIGGLTNSLKPAAPTPIPAANPGQPVFGPMGMPNPQLINFDRPGQGNMFGNAASLGGLGAPIQF